MLNAAPGTATAVTVFAIAMLLTSLAGAAMAIPPPINATAGKTA
jgi:hypothetical protein